MLDPDPAESKALGSGLVPAGSNISGSGVDPDPAGSKNSGSGAPLVETVVFERGWVTLCTNFRGKLESSTNDFWHQKTRVPGLSRGVVCVILCLAVLIQYRRVTDTQTDT